MGPKSKTVQCKMSCTTPSTNGDSNGCFQNRLQSNMSRSTTWGVWSKQERSLHINVLELLAVKLAGLSFTKNREVKATHFQIDNATALRYFRKMRSVMSLEMIKLSKEIWDYLLSHGITITTEYLPTKLNIIADRESREKVDSSELKLDPKVFQRLVQLMGNPAVDFFASRLSHKLHQYRAWSLDPFSQGTDVMHQDWSQNYLYAFPPFCLISRILQMVG